jgi:hypothetical protein
MKTRQSISKRIILVCFINIMVVSSLVSVLTSCDKDDEGPSIWGSYSVEETDQYDEVENYTITFTQSKLGGANVEISNFGDFMFVPVKGTLNENTLTIPAQTFTAGNKTIVITGNGTLTGNKLNFDYSMETGGDTFEYSCAAAKQ